MSTFHIQVWGQFKTNKILLADGISGLTSDHGVRGWQINPLHRKTQNKSTLLINTKGSDVVVASVGILSGRAVWAWPFPRAVPRDCPQSPVGSQNGGHSARDQKIDKVHAGCEVTMETSPPHHSLTPLLQRHVAEEVGDGLSVVSPPDGLRQDHGDVNHLQQYQG